MKRLARIVALVLPLALAVGGCAGSSGPGRPLPILTPDERIELGRAIAPQLENEYGGRLADLAVQAYVRTVGERLARALPVPAAPFRFMVLAGDDIDLFAVPGGTIYITAGLLGKLESEGELAAALGHQMGHIAAGHLASELTRMVGYGGLVEAAAEAARRSPVEPSAASMDRFVQITGAVRRLKYTLEMEQEADRLALDYLAASGYNPAEVARLLALWATLDGPNPPGLLRAHVAPDCRVRLARELADRKYPGRGGRVAEDEYRREILSRLKRDVPPPAEAP